VPGFEPNGSAFEIAAGALLSPNESEAVPAAKPLFKTIWGGATAALVRTRKLTGVDALVVIGLIGLALALLSVGREWTGELRPTVEIDLSASALPRYALFSLSRGLLAYVLSLSFTLVYGYWAAKDRLAERLLVPALDILQSIPVLGFMPGLVLALVALFPRSNIGLELAAVVMIFTGQAWNMTFSFYHSLRSVPQDQREASTVYRFNWWQRLKWVELPFSALGLVWNSMMSMAGGWFFLMINEAFVLGDQDFRLPGLGSYMSVAVARGDVGAMVGAVAAMSAMIVLVDQVLWRPVVVWAQKFRVEESAEAEVVSSWLLDWLRRSRLIAWASGRLRQLASWRAGAARPASGTREEAARPWPAAASKVLLAALVLAFALGSYRLIEMLGTVSGSQWSATLLSAFATLGRVLAAVALGTLWALPAGLAIGLSPRLSRRLQPVVQVVASFPAPMLFPAVIALLHLLHVSLGWGSIVLMLLGTQWYILFNVVAGAMAIPADLREAARSYRIGGFQRFRLVLFPAVFPYLVTGWVTAAGGAWNASIVAEYVSFRGSTLSTWGIGAQISRAAEQGKFALLAAGVVVLSATVVAFNRTVWRRLYQIAEERFSLAK
jgi:NitT/TauT family transport system permease protein